MQNYIVLVTIPGDVSGDGKVAVLDLFSLGKAYGASRAVQTGTSLVT